MIHHVSIGVSDVARAKRFYDAALAPLGAKCLSEDASALGYGGGDGPRLWLLAANAKVPRDCTSVWKPAGAPRWTLFTQPRSIRVAATTASPDCAPTTVKTITLLS